MENVPPNAEEDDQADERESRWTIFEHTGPIPQGDKRDDADELLGAYDD